MANNGSVDSFNDKGFSHYIKWCLVAVFGLAFVTVACFGEVSDPLMWATGIMFAYAFGERLVRNYVKAATSVPTQAIKSDDVVKLVETVSKGTIDYNEEFESPDVSLPIAPTPDLNKPQMAYGSLPPDGQKWVDELYERQVTQKPSDKDLKGIRVREKELDAEEKWKAVTEFTEKVFPSSELTAEAQLLIKNHGCEVGGGYTRYLSSCFMLAKEAYRRYVVALLEAKA